MVTKLTKEEEIRKDELQAQLNRLVTLEDKIKKELCGLIYKLEKIS